MKRLPAPPLIWLGWTPPRDSLEVRQRYSSLHIHDKIFLPGPSLLLFLSSVVIPGRPSAQIDRPLLESRLGGAPSGLCTAAHSSPPLPAKLHKNLYDCFTVEGSKSWFRARICRRLWGPGIDSASLCSLADRYVNCFVVPARQARNRFLGS